MVTLDLVLLILSFVCFVCAAFGVSSGRVALVPAGLAFLVLSMVL